MREVTAILLLFISALCVPAQENLVKDPSFEEYKKCPNGITQSAQRFSLKSWYLPTGGTPEYYNTCSDNASNTVPMNKAGFQYPHSGKGYVGMTCWPTFCEYVQTELIKPLEKDTNYYVELWVSMANTSGRACKKIGVYFDDSKMNDMTIENALDVHPQFYTDSIIQDTAHWIKVSGRFTAKGGERYIIVGSFALSKKDYIRIRYNKHSYFNTVARYYMDDVCVKQVRKGKPCNCEKGQSLPAQEKIKPLIKTYTPGAIITLPDITFEVNKWELRENAKPFLDSLANYLQKHKNLTLNIYGHTDNIGTSESNQKLSENRAKAVAEYLISKGIEATRITAKGYGSIKPVASNNTDEGKAKNRRVELLIIE